MTATNDSIRAAYWFDLGSTDAIQGRECLATVLAMTGDDLATSSYFDGWTAGLLQMAA